MNVHPWKRMSKTRSSDNGIVSLIYVVTVLPNVSMVTGPFGQDPQLVRLDAAQTGCFLRSVSLHVKPPERLEQAVGPHPTPLC